MKKSIDEIVLAHVDMGRMLDMARAALRYEALRRLNPNQFTALYTSALRGKPFDELVDMLVIDMRTDKMRSIFNGKCNAAINGSEQ